jgi:Universal stress protein family
MVADLQLDVLFLGAYGNNRLDRRVLGSTAETLLRTLPCPVVTIRPKDSKTNSDPNQPEKVICPIDFPDDVHERLRIIKNAPCAIFAFAQSGEVELLRDHSCPFNGDGIHVFTIAWCSASGLASVPWSS